MEVIKLLCFFLSSPSLVRGEGMQSVIMKIVNSKNQTEIAQDHPNIIFVTEHGLKYEI